MRNKYAASAIALTLGLVACSGPSVEAQTELPGPIVSTEWLAEHMDASDVVVVGHDVRASASETVIGRDMAISSRLPVSACYRLGP